MNHCVVVVEEPESGGVIVGFRPVSDLSGHRFLGQFVPAILDILEHPSAVLTFHGLELSLSEGWFILFGPSQFRIVVCLPGSWLQIALSEVSLHS